MNLLQIATGSLLLVTGLPFTYATKTPDEFHLFSSSPEPQFDNLYLSTQSTGPLNSIPVFRDPAHAASFYVTNSSVNYIAPNKAPWVLALVHGGSAQENVEVSVSPSATVATSTGFHVSHGRQLESEDKSWGSWLVCAGQQTSLLELFYQNITVDRDIPNGCGQVQLIVANV
ncbi:hypothetical protein N7539_006749 [Penicillium diatomitis]|uniref:DUF7907 domain-containing protein n=1 Tax=Penicillium diatomitis TaxID=2819901 RepID=A0A9W9X1U5_9EURO|nr:uncharacterized protein N7539_006749 [Penicillium diatomitis]KAJ5480855.1 hypothetical protein N7539_006749 [Penicillium diatomitis]